MEINQIKGNILNTKRGRIALAAFFSFIILAVAGIVYYYFFFASAASIQVIQTNWSGGASASVGTTSGWTQYSSVDIGITAAAGNVALTTQSPAEANPASLTAPDIRGYWKFDDVDHSVAADSGLLALDGVDGESASTYYSTRGTGFNDANTGLRVFPGYYANSFAQVPAYTGYIKSVGNGLYLPNKLALEMWYRPTSIPNRASDLFDFDNPDSSGNGYVLGQTATGQLFFNVYRGGGSANYFTVNTGSLTLCKNQWYHIVATYDNAATATDGELKIYVNGMLVGSTITTLNAQINYGTAYNYAIIGASYAPSSGGGNPNARVTDGTIDNVVVYGRALTLAEVQSRAQSISTATAGSVLESSPFSILDFGTAQTYAITTPVTNVAGTAACGVSVAFATSPDNITYSDYTSYSSQLTGSLAALTGVDQFIKYKLQFAGDGIARPLVSNVTMNLNTTPPEYTSTTPAYIFAGTTDTVVTITGNNFISGITTLWMNGLYSSGTQLAVTYVDQQHIQVTIPTAMLLSEARHYMYIYNSQVTGYAFGLFDVIATPAVSFPTTIFAQDQSITSVNVSVDMNYTLDATTTAKFKLVNLGSTTYGLSGDYYVDTTNPNVTYNDITNIGTITFPSGVPPQTIPVVTINHAVIAPNKSFQIVLDSLSYVPGIVGANSTYTYTIISSHNAGFSPIANSNSESVYYQLVYVNLDNVNSVDTNVAFHFAGTATYGTSAPGDYYVNSGTGFSYTQETNTGTVTIPAGSLSKSFYLLINNDLVAEYAETVQVVLDSNNAGYITSGAGTYTYTIAIDNNDANRIGFAVSSASGSESTTPYNVTVQLDIIDNTQPTTFNFSVGGTATSTSDYTVSTGEFIIPLGSTTTDVPIPINIVNDAINEPNETVVLTLTSSDNVVGGTIVFTYTITNDDPVSAKIFLDSGYTTTEANVTSNKITIGDPLYLQINDARFNASAGSIDSISTGASVISTGGDSVDVTLTETAANSNIFQTTLATGAGAFILNNVTLEITASDVVDLAISSSSSATIDDFSAYTSTANLTINPNSQAGVWTAVQIAPDSPSLQNNAGNQYLSSTSSAGDMYITRGLGSGASAGYNFTETNLGFDIAISNTGYTTASWNFGSQTFTGLNVLLGDNAGCFYYQHVTNPSPVSSNASALTTVNLARAGFMQSSLSGACSFNFADVRSTYFIVPSAIVNTVTIDNLLQNSNINFQSPNAAVVGGATPVTLHAAANITTTSMDLDWTENTTDVDFANYKIYYSTTSPVSLASSLFATITDRAMTTLSITGLTPSTLYYVRVFVTNTNATAGSNEVSATTSAPFNACPGDGVICIMDSNSFNSAPASIVLGASLYFQLNSNASNTNPGVAETVSVTVTSGLTSDSEVRTLTEDAVNSGVFKSGATVGTGLTQSLATSSSNSSGVMQTSNEDTITASYSIVSNVASDDFESWVDSADMADSPTPNWQAFMGSPLTLGPTGTQTGGNDYLHLAVSDTNTSGDLAYYDAGSAIDFGTDALKFQITTDNNSAISYSTTFGTLTTFSGFSVMLANQSGQLSIYTATSLLGTCPVGGPSYCSISQSAFTAENHQFNESGTPNPLISNWSNIANIYFIFATSDGATGNAVNIQIDNIGHGGSSSVSDGVSVTGAVTPIAVTLNAATNITTSSMDLSWSQNVDGDFASYKIYYATHSNVNFADPVETTIADQSVTTYTIPNLTQGVTYYIKVLVTNNVGDTAFSNEVVRITNPDAGITSLSDTVTLTASVDPTISFTLDTTNCNFGALASTTVKTCVINVEVATNATGGYSAYIRDVNNGTLNSGTDNINAVGGTSLNVNTEGFGVSTSVDQQDLVQETDCSAASLPINVQPITTSYQSFSAASAPVAGDQIVLCMAASITDTTPAGSYSDTAYITVVGNF